MKSAANERSVRDIVLEEALAGAGTPREEGRAPAATGAEATGAEATEAKRAADTEATRILTDARNSVTAAVNAARSELLATVVERVREACLAALKEGEERERFLALTLSEMPGKPSRVRVAPEDVGRARALLGKGAEVIPDPGVSGGAVGEFTDRSLVVVNSLEERVSRLRTHLTQELAYRLFE